MYTVVFVKDAQICSLGAKPTEEEAVQLIIKAAADCLIDLDNQDVAIVHPDGEVHGFSLDAEE